MEFKYNPGFSSDADLIVSFVVRKPYLDLILENLRENTGAANQHVLVVGARGTGKTMLVRRVAAEVRTESKLNEQWYPLVFAEESYQITSVGEFWLEALFHVADQTQEASWQTVYEELRTESDETRLRQRALAQLMDFADAQGKRIVLVVENLNMLFAEQLGSHDDWELRHTLQNEPRLMLLGSATQRFEQIEAIQKAWFEFFTIYQLEALSLEDCRVLWTGITGKPVHNNRLKPIKILTGGNPRLLRILIDFAVDLSLKDLMANLSQLIDEHTDYFKSHLDNLAAAERKVFIALLEIWDPIGAREVATGSRMGVSQVSALLNRLVSRGAVTVVQGKSRKKLYQATERLYNIYYLMRRRSHPSSRVQAAVTFMVNFYQGDELVDATAKLVKQADMLDPTQRIEHFLLYQGILEAAKQSNLRRKLLKKVPDDFLQASDRPDLLKFLTSWQIESFSTKTHKWWKDFQAGNELLENGNCNEAIISYDKAIKLGSNFSAIWTNRGFALGESGRSKEAIDSYERAIKINPNDFIAWSNRGHELSVIGFNEESISSYKKAINLNPNYPVAWISLGIKLLDLGRIDEAVLNYDQAIKFNQKNPEIWYGRGRAMSSLGCYKEALKSYDKAIKLNSMKHEIWLQRGIILHNLGLYEAAVASYDKLIDIYPNDPDIWTVRGFSLSALGHREEAIASYDKAIEVNPDDHQALLNRAYEMFELNRIEEAEFSVRQVVKKDPNDWGALYFLVLLLKKQEKWSETLAFLEFLLNKPEVIKDNMINIIEFIIQISTIVNAAKIFQILSESASATELESLAVGLQIYLGEQPLVAQEILEVGQDVAQRIREQCLNTQALNSPSSNTSS
jgi:tetratricopeptide (TPR) repeat protein